MAIDIDVVSGFLESGKTTFINELITGNTFEEYENIGLLVCEEGEVEYDEKFLKENNISLTVIEEPSMLTGDYLLELTSKKDLDYIIIEYNGTWNIQTLLDIKLKGGLKLRNVLFISEADKFNSYYHNMAGLLQPHMKNSDYVVINRHDSLNKEERKNIQNNVKRVNKGTGTVFLNSIHEDSRLLRIFTPFENYKKTVTPGMLILMVVLGILCFLPTASLSVVYVNLQKVSLSFLSILIQAIPFILLGAFLSSFLQLVIPTSWIIRQISGNTVKSFGIAALAGFCFPVCDCGLAPFITGLLKKGTPLPQVITFWLASAAVNPVVLLSVMYAFPENKLIILIRILAGVFIALAIGIILKLLDIKNSDVVKADSSLSGMGIDMVYDSNNRGLRKASVVLKGAQIEFFRVFQYVIIGALVSSVSLTFVPQVIKSLISGNMLIQFGIMFIAAAFMSTCSTTNAFIGRSFYGQFTLPAVLSFMTLGPMLDFKNIIILSEALTKKFIVQLCLLMAVVGFLAYSLINIIL
ncbi:MAG: permease [Anaerocolumna sp.]|jgi:uncharacterized membrane protein YraQ (UPF0718 family)/Ni2+-binding GTPase involved in maturation of urease and hydrogenase|nr:permease [Anaerocolumna sp.]